MSSSIVHLFLRRGALAKASVRQTGIHPVLGLQAHTTVSRVLPGILLGVEIRRSFEDIASPHVVPVCYSCEQ